jgi:hypothetical protein
MMINEAKLKNSFVHVEQVNAFITAAQHKVVVVETELKGIEHWGLKLEGINELSIRFNLSVLQAHVKIAHALLGEQPRADDTVIEGWRIWRCLLVIQARVAESTYNEVLFGRQNGNMLGVMSYLLKDTWVALELEFLKHFNIEEEVE